jgi:DNA-nicking Smr family endonuclease
MASPTHSVDLHGLAPDQALRRLEQALHTARVRGEKQLHVITGRGWGNREQKPVLRMKVEAWLQGPEGRSRGVSRVSVVQKGGALDVELG